MAAFVDGTLAEGDRAEAASHLAACTECRAELAAVSRMVGSLPARRHRAVARPRVLALGAIAAAAAVLAVVTLQRTDPVDTGASGLERRLPEPTTRVATISPAEGAAVDPRELVVSWHGSDGASYRVTLTDESGRMVWTTSTTETSARVPGNALGPTPSRYYWYVDALLADGSSTSSGPQSFSTAVK